MEFSIADSAWENMSYEEKNHELFLRQKNTLDAFLVRRAITQDQYDRSLHDMAEKMGEALA